MELGIIGLPGSGKSTLFEALTQQIYDPRQKRGSRVATVTIPDERVDILSRIYNPKKTVYAQVRYLLPLEKDAPPSQDTWMHVRDCDALIHVIRNFSEPGIEPPSPSEDFFRLDQELILSDLVMVEKRIERISLDKRRGQKIDPEELHQLYACFKMLEGGIPLRREHQLASSRLLKGYALASAKPTLVLFNNNDDDNALPHVGDLVFEEECTVVRGKLEQELAQMSSQEAQDFLEAFEIEASATTRIIRQSLKLLGLISFFTVGDNEVRAWTVPTGTSAIDASGVIHSDMKQGFIRAEALSFDDLVAAGSHQAAKKKGVVRLEGKMYQIKDGEILRIRFNV